MGSTPSNIPSNNVVVALQIENFEKIKDLIDSKLKKDKDFINKPVNKMDDRILHYAAFKKHKQLIQYLLEKGADVELKNSRGLTAIDVAEDEEIKKILQK